MSLRVLRIALVSTALLLSTTARAQDDKPSVLIVMPHPDDETMMGDVLGRMKERGFRVTIALITNGENGQVVSGIDPKKDDPIVESFPGQKKANKKNIRSKADLARARRQELRRAAKRHGASEVVFLSSPDQPDFVDDYDGGVTSWDPKALRKKLRAVSKKSRPDVVITMNPDPEWVHPQHSGVGKLVRELYDAGNFSTGKRAPALYAIRENDWYEQSKDSQPGDEVFARGERSRLLGKTYGEHMRSGAKVYKTQSSTPKALAARADKGIVPGYQDVGILRRLDTGSAPGVSALLEAHEPLQKLRAPKLAVTKLHPGKKEIAASKKKADRKALVQVMRKRVESGKSIPKRMARAFGKRQTRRLVEKSRARARRSR